MPLTEEERLTWEGGIYRVSDVEGLNFEHRPLAHTVYEGITYTTDEFGMRHGGNSMEKGENVFRIAAVGDSYTYGYGLNVENSYTSMLQSKMNSDSLDMRYEVLNFGVISYSSVNNAAVVCKKIPQWDVDLIVYLHVMNDAQTDADIFMHYYEERNYLHNFHIYRLIELKINQLQRVTSSHKGYFEQNYDVNAQNWWDVQKAFKDMALKTKEMKIPMVFVLFPTTSWDDEWADRDLMSSFYHQVLKEASQNNFDLIIDLNEILSEQNPKDMRISEMDEHPSVLANDLFSDHLIEKLKECGLLNPRE